MNWEIENWDEDIIIEQKKIVEESWKIFLRDYYTKELEANVVKLQQATDM